MSKPWEFRTDDKRDPDTLPTYIIFCEDQNCEPIYLKYFETEKIKVNPIKSQKSKFDNVKNALCHCREHGLMGEEGGQEVLAAEGVQVWCVFDRDKEAEEDVAKGDADFDMSIDAAALKGFNVAWSNDAFELWILLHFEDVDVDVVENRDRGKYYERLTEIFRNLPDPVDRLVNATSHDSFSYKGDLKREKNFRIIVRPEVEKFITKAIERAKQLDSHFDDGIQNSQKSPLTLMYKLVEDLIDSGGRKIL